MTMLRLVAVLSPVALFALLSACAGPPAAAPEPPPAVVIAPEPAPQPPDDGSIPPPRAVPLAGEPSDAKDAMELFVIARPNGLLRVQYPAGQRVLLGGGNVDDKLVLPANRPVRFTCIGDEAPAAFEIPAFQLSVEAKVGAYSSRAAEPTRAGEYGVWNGRRVGSVVVVTDREFTDWLAGIVPLPGANPVDGSLAHTGRQLFLKLQCINCHSAKADAKAPLLEGLYGTKVALKGGGAEIADEHYIIESIRKPRLKVVDGWEAIMPAYDETQVSAEELNALAAYVRSLKKGQTPDRIERFPPPVGAPKDVPQPRLEPLVPRPGDSRPKTPPGPGGSPELRPEDLRPDAEATLRKQLLESGFDPAGVDEALRKLFPLPVAPPPREK